MSSENPPELPERETRIIDFRFPNETPRDVAISLMEKVLPHRFDGVLLKRESVSEIGTIWFGDVSFLVEKPRKEIEDMNEEELGLELLCERHMPDEY